ncbi:MAG: hypothetical protein KBC81_03780 [Candidatus Pacebacteria bacterium]|nr:hypothetical protein [Candidatus Paceibacterota bacterium]
MKKQKREERKKRLQGIRERFGSGETVQLNRESYLELVEDVRRIAFSESNEELAQLRDENRQLDLATGHLDEIYLGSVAQRKSIERDLRFYRDQADVAGQALEGVRADLVEKRAAGNESERQVRQRDKLIFALMLPWFASLGTVGTQEVLEEFLKSARVGIDPSIYPDIHRVLNAQLAETMERGKMTGAPEDNGLEIIKMAIASFIVEARVAFPKLDTP